jgi:hypothetical protein
MSDDLRDRRQQMAAATEQPTPAAEQQSSALARHGDPSVKKTNSRHAARGSVSGVEWVRLSDVLTGRGQRLAGLHADGQTRLVKRMRHGMARAAMSRRGVANASAPNLPPVTAFGSAPPQSSGQAVGR